MMEDKVVALSMLVKKENEDCHDHFAKNEDSFERHLKDREEIQRLRDRLKELERDIHIMELKLLWNSKVKSLELLQSRKTYYCSNCKAKGDDSGSSENFYAKALADKLGNQSGGEKKSTRAQVESLAKDRGLKVDFVFMKPPGFVYRIG